LDAFQRAWGNIQTEFSCNGNRAGLLLVVELAVTTFHSDLYPTILSKLLNDGPDFHPAIFTGMSSVNNQQFSTLSIGKKLEVRDAVRLRQYSRATETAYTSGMQHYILLPGSRN
jgi:hypothetical protein